MGYWIIVILIVLAGLLVLLAAASADAHDRADDAPEPRRNSAGVDTNRTRHKPDSPFSVPVTTFIPRTWCHHERYEFTPDVPGTSLRVDVVDGSTLAAIADAVEPRAQALRDSVVVIVAGADDFLAGEPLENVFDQLDRLLDQLAELPAMAVIASLPNVSSALAEAEIGVPDEPLGEAIAVWNDAIADMAGTFSAEFADVTAVPVTLVNSGNEDPDTFVVAVPDAAALAAALAPAIARATARVRSERAHS